MLHVDGIASNVLYCYFADLNPVQYCLNKREKERQRDRDRQTDRQTERETDRERETQRGTDRVQYHLVAGTSSGPIDSPT